MRRMGGWLGRAGNNASTQSLSSLDEPQALRDAMAAASHILNDDVDRAELELGAGNSPFHKLGKGMVTFLRAVLGFEQDIMKEASERLSDAENAATEHHRRAERDAFQSSIYPVGSEYALCYAESQLMSAVVAVLNESLTESIKGFYRLRKAYYTLMEIAEAEKRYLKSKSTTSVESLSRKATASQTSLKSSSMDKIAANGKAVHSAVAVPQTSQSSLPNGQSTGDDDEDNDFDFVDADEDLEDKPPVTYQGHLVRDDLEKDLSAMKLDSSPPHYSQKDENPDDETDYSEHFTHPIDIFIHSGTSLCYGVLQLLLSLVPPAFTKLLSIIGFRGDRDAGISMLWRASQYDNINGGLAGLITLGYYNGVIGFCDILTEGVYPEARCRALLEQMRKRYPRSRLWQLEHSRMLAGDRKLEEAVAITGNIPTAETGGFKQVVALQYFEHSLNSMYLHHYEECAKSFLKCIELNNWSHGLYYYIAGCCYVELYREEKTKNPERAAKYAARATEVLGKVAAHAGKKRFMARQLPFDVFVSRKITKWETRATRLGLSFVDAVGTSPIEEMIYFWNGYKRMRKEHLEISLQKLVWSEESGDDNPLWKKGDVEDERAVLTLLKAATMARIGGERETEAKALLSDLKARQSSEFKGVGKENWILPVANYEWALLHWVAGGGARGVGSRDEDLKICAEYVDKVARWESYDLDARVGMKVRTAQDTLKKCGISSTT